MRIGGPLYYVIVVAVIALIMVIKNRRDARLERAGMWLPERNMLFAPTLAILLLLAVVAPRMLERRRAAGEAAPAAASALASLRWLEGYWRGTEGGRNPFFEEYQMIGDTLLRIRYHADSTFAAATDSGAVFARGDTLYHEAGGAVWRATRVDSVEATFEPHQHATNAFTWHRDGPDAWTATLRQPGATATVYRLERVRLPARSGP
jgi:hypothetical protein